MPFWHKLVAFAVQLAAWAEIPIVCLCDLGGFGIACLLKLSLCNILEDSGTYLDIITQTA